MAEIRLVQTFWALCRHEELRWCCYADRATFPVCHPVRIPHLFSPSWHILRLQLRDHVCGEWCSPGRGVSRPCKSYQNGVCCLIFSHPWVRNPDYLLLQTNKTRMYWGANSLSGTRNTAGVAKLSSGGRKKVLVFSRGQQLWQMLKWCLPRLPHCSWVLAYYLPKKMTEWVQNRAFHGLLIGSDPPHSAGSQEQVYGSAAPVVLDHNPWPISCFFYWNKQIFLIGSVRRTAFLEAC